MTRPDHLLAALCLSLGFALAGCSKSSKSAPIEPDQTPAPAPAPTPAFRFEPVQPRIGAAIDINGAWAWAEKEATNLIAQGKLNPYLLLQTPPATCRLHLAPVTQESIAPQKLYEKAQMSVCVLLVLNVSTNSALSPSQASGFFITDSGALVTCYHAFHTNAGCGVVVMTRDGMAYPVKAVLAANATNDVAILQVEGSSFTPLPIESHAPVGSPVWILGHPEFVFYSLTSGIVSGYIDSGLYPTAPHVTWMTTTADFAGGSSGAPVLNENGSVVGVASWATAAHNYANEPVMFLKYCVPSEAILKLIQQE